MFSDNVRIVMIETSHPGNIGAAARAMKNMCLRHLYLVNPNKHPSGVATARASGALDVLDGATVCDSLEQALEGCNLVIGASARLRSLEWPQIDSRECGIKAVEAAKTQQVAIVFGRERSGLTNDELARCHYLMHIPTNQAYSSLNVASAIQVVAYEIHMQAQMNSDTAVEESEEEPAASAEKMESYFTHLQETLAELGFLQGEQNKKLMRRLRRLYNRTCPTETELDILHGILSAAEGKKYQWMKDRLDLLSQELNNAENKNTDKNG